MAVAVFSIRRRREGGPSDRGGLHPLVVLKRPFSSDGPEPLDSGSATQPATIAAMTPAFSGSCVSRDEYRRHFREAPGAPSTWTRVGYEWEWASRSAGSDGSVMPR